MKKFLYSLFACLFLVLMVPTVKANAATTPEVIQYGKQYTITPAEYGKDYILNLAPGQKVTFNSSVTLYKRTYSTDSKTDVDYYDTYPTASYSLTGTDAIKEFHFGKDYVIVNTSNQWANAYVYVYNITTDDSLLTPTNAVFSFSNGIETLNNSVTKATANGQTNVYAFTPKLSGVYSFTVKLPSDTLISSSIAVVTFADNKVKYLNWYEDASYSYAAGQKYATLSYTLWAGVTYYISVNAGSTNFYNYTDTDGTITKRYYNTDKGYTLAITKSPSVPVASVTAKKASAAKKAVKLTWKKAANVTGYEISYSTSKKFTNAKVKYVSASAASAKITGLKSKKTYYVRVRAFRTVEGNKYFGAYSKTLKAKAK